MAILEQPRELTVTEATQRGVAGLVADAEQGSTVVVTRHHRPVAALVAYRELQEFLGWLTISGIWRSSWRALRQTAETGPRSTRG